MLKKLQLVGLLLMALLTLVACSQPRNDLQVSDFPTIGSGLTKSQLEEAVGAPHQKITNSIDILNTMTFLFYQAGSIDVDSSWDINDTIDVIYLYELDGGQKGMFAYIIDNQVVEITTQPVSLE